MAKVLLVALGVTGVCVVIHITGLVALGEELLRRRDKIEERITFIKAAVLLIMIFAVIIFLHVLEATVWAGVFFWGGLFPNFEMALYCSLTSYSTAGYGDVLLPPNWRLLGTIEAISGVLLCGLSGAFLFAVVNGLFQFSGLRVGRDRVSKTEN